MIRNHAILALALAVAALLGCGVGEKPQAAGGDGAAAPGNGTTGAPVARPDVDSRTPVALAAAMRATASEDTSGPVVAVESRAVPENVSFGDAERVFRAGDYERAVELFDAYATRRPENPWGHYMIGISAWRAGDHGRAEAALRRTLDVDPNHGRGRINLARVLLEQRKASDALDVIEPVVESDPDDGEAWRVLGNARSDLGMVDLAADAYRRALVLSHRDAWTMNNLGLLLIRAGRPEEALPPLARATELRPDVAVFQNNLGIALERSGYPVQAAEAFRAALEANPDHARARGNLERVEPLAARSSGPPLDLFELADRFADEVQRWADAAFEESNDVPNGETSEDEYEC